MAVMHDYARKVAEKNKPRGKLTKGWLVGVFATALTGVGLGGIMTYGLDKAEFVTDMKPIATEDMNKFFPHTYSMYERQNDPMVLMHQGRLEKLSYLGSEDIDGQYGPRTTEATRTFQRDYNLPTTGKADPQTQLTLHNAAANMMQDSYKITLPRTKAKPPTP